MKTSFNFAVLLISFLSVGSNKAYSQAAAVKQVGKAGHKVEEVLKEFRRGAKGNLIREAVEGAETVATPTTIKSGRTFLTQIGSERPALKGLAENEDSDLYKLLNKVRTSVSPQGKTLDPDHPYVQQVFRAKLAEFLDDGGAIKTAALAEALKKPMFNKEPKLSVSLQDNEIKAAETLISGLPEVKSASGTPIKPAEEFNKLSPEQKNVVMQWSTHWARGGRFNESVPQTGDTGVDFVLAALYKNRLSGKIHEAPAEIAAASALGAKGQDMQKTLGSLVSKGIITNDQATDFANAVGKENAGLRGLKPDNELLKSEEGRAKLAEAYSLIRAADEKDAGTLGANPSALLNRLASWDEAALDGVISLRKQVGSGKKARDHLASLQAGLNKEIKDLEATIAKAKDQKMNVDESQKRLAALIEHKKALDADVKNADGLDDDVAETTATLHSLKRLGFSDEDAHKMIKCLRNPS